MTSKENFPSDVSEVFHLSRKRYISGNSELPANKKPCLRESMDKLANFSLSSNGVNKDTLRKKPAADKKVLTIRLVSGELLSYCYLLLLSLF